MAKLWIQEAIKKPGALREQLGVKEGEKISVALLRNIKERLQKKAEERKLTPAELKLLRRVILALTLKRLGK